MTSGNSINIQDTVCSIISMNNPAGSWGLSADIKSKGTIKLVSGTFTTNNYNITCSKFISNYATANRTLNLGTSSVTIKAYQYDTGGGPVFVSWYLDNILTINGSPTEIHFEIPDEADTTNFTLVFATDITFHGGNHDYSNIYGSAPGFYGTTIIVLSTSLNFGTSKVNSIKLDNSTYTDIFFNGLHADSIILTGDTDPQLYIGIGDTLVSDYIEAGTTTIETPRFSLINRANIKGDFSTIIPNLGGTPDNINVFNDLYVQGNFTETNNTGFGFNSAYFKKCVINGNGTFNDSCTFDTLMLSAGKTYVIGSGDYITVNNTFIAFGTPANNIQINSDQVGIQSGIILHKAMFVLTT